MIPTNKNYCVYPDLLTDAKVLTGLLGSFEVNYSAILPVAMFSYFLAVPTKASNCYSESMVAVVNYHQNAPT